MYQGYSGLVDSTVHFENPNGGNRTEAKILRLSLESEGPGLYGLRKERKRRKIDKKKILIFDGRSSTICPRYVMLFHVLVINENGCCALHNDPNKHDDKNNIVCAKHLHLVTIILPELRCLSTHTLRIQPLFSVFPYPCLSLNVSSRRYPTKLRSSENGLSLFSRKFTHPRSNDRMLHKLI